MTPDSFLANAERMLEGPDGSDACTSRAVIHAAYYAVFHLSAGILNMNVRGENPAKHSDVMRAVMANTIKSRVIYEAKINYRRLKLARERADYGLDEAVGRDTATDAVQWAYDVFDAAGITPTTV